MESSTEPSADVEPSEVDVVDIHHVEITPDAEPATCCLQEFEVLPHQHAPIPPEVKNLNTISHLITLKERQLSSLDHEISSTQNTMHEQEKKTIASLTAEKEEKLKFFETQLKLDMKKKLQFKNVHYYLKKKKLTSGNQAKILLLQTILRISDEWQYLIKCFYAEQIHQSSHYRVNKDGTSCQKIKKLETSLTLDSDEILPLGFRRLAKEDGQSVADNTKLELSEVCTTTQDYDLFKVEALSKLSFLMSDRAATETKANKMLNTWVQEEFKKTNAPATVVHTLYCMAHVLLGFHRYSTEDLTKLQKEFIAEGRKLGRDANGAYFHFKAQLAVTRISEWCHRFWGKC